MILQIGIKSMDHDSYSHPHHSPSCWLYPVCRLPLPLTLPTLRLLAISTVPPSPSLYLALTATAGDIKCVAFLCSQPNLGCTSGRYPVCWLPLLFTLPELRLLTISCATISCALSDSLTASPSDIQCADILRSSPYSHYDSWRYSVCWLPLLTLITTPGDIQCADLLRCSPHHDYGSWRYPVYRLPLHITLLWLRFLAISSVPISSALQLTLTSTPGDIQCADFLSTSPYFDFDSWRYPVCRLPLHITLLWLRLLAISSVPTSCVLYLPLTATPGDIQCADFLRSLPSLNRDSWRYPVCRLPAFFTFP